MEKYRIVAEGCTDEFDGMSIDEIVSDLHNECKGAVNVISVVRISEAVSEVGADKVQALPCGSGRDIAELVKNDIEARAQLGMKKYGERLKANNGRDSLLDAYQEALDLCMYIRQKLEEQKLV